MRARQISVGGVLLMGLCLAGRVAMAHTGGEALSLPAMKPHPANHPVTAQMLGMPLQFEANHGQVDEQVKFLARGKGYTLFLMPTESVMVLQQREERAQVENQSGYDPLAEPTPIKQAVVRMKLEGANPSPAIDGMEKLPGIVNYFIGNDPAKWRTKIPTYAQVQYQEAYPGIDLAYYGNQGKLEYDFIVAPGADPNRIKLAFEGASEITVADSGDLLLTTALGEVRLQKPVVYQVEENGHKTLVAGNFIASSTTSVQIQLASYDRAKPLVIDPVLDYATYLGGTLGDGDPDIAVDGSGNAYVAGGTASLDFPVTGGAYDTTFNANPSCPGITITNTTCLDPISGANLNTDIFVAKLNPAGTALVYATYLGGTGLDGIARITVDLSGQVFVVGQTRSANFPVTAGAFQTAFHECPPPNQAPANCSADMFVTKLNAAGSNLEYSTFLGGTGGEFAYGVAADGSGNAYVAWFGLSTDFPTTPGAFDTTCGPGGVTKINPAGTALVWSTCLSPLVTTNIHNPRAIAIDSGGNVILAGEAQGSLVTTVSPAQGTYGGGTDAFVWKLNSSGSGLIFATFLGGSGLDRAFGVAVDSADNIYVTGQTNSANFPTTPGAFDTSYNGGLDIFVTKLNASGNLQYSTYLGGSLDECFISNCDIGVDPAGQAYVAGETTSTNFPTLNALDSSHNGSRDAVFSVLKADGSGLVSSTFIGGSGEEARVNLAMLPSGVVYLAGNTTSSNFPVTAGVFQPTLHLSGDAFVVRISNKPLADAGPDQSVSMGTVVTLNATGSSGGSLTYSWTKVPGGPTVALTGATTAHPTFTAPTVPSTGGTVTFELVVCEGTSSNCSDPDTVNVHIMNINRPPVAEAGPDQTVQEGSLVLLNGSASYDPDVESITYTWLQVFGPTVTLAYSNTATPSFTAPPVGASGGQVDFELIVTDARGLNHADYISVFISNVNQPPISNAGPDQTRNENTLVTLDGGASSDPDLDSLNYSWAQTGGPTVLLTGANTPSPTFTAPNVGPGGALLTFQLTVNDGQASGGADTVQVVVQDVNDPPVCTLAQPSVAVLWPPNHTMVAVSIMGVTDPNNSDITISYPRVTQDEPINGLGDGDTSPDAAESGNNILLRAERSGSGNGRVYAVQFRATDPDGASCTGTVKVSVPKSIKDTAVDNGQNYNSFGP